MYREAYPTNEKLIVSVSETTTLMESVSMPPGAAVLPDTRTGSLLGLLTSSSDELGRVLNTVLPGDFNAVSSLEPYGQSTSTGELLHGLRANSSSLLCSNSQFRDRICPPKLVLPENPTDDNSILNLVQTFAVKRAPIIKIVTPPNKEQELPAKPLTRKQSASIHTKKSVQLTAPTPTEEEHSYRSEYMEQSQIESPEEEQPVSQNHHCHGSNARPDKNMKKIIFTPFKKVLNDARLKNDYGIDLTDYFRMCPNTLYGHRTWMDFEIVFWFVQQRYKDSPGAFERFLDYMNQNRHEIDENGKTSYGKPQDKEWLKVYKKYTECIYRAMNSKQSSEGRLGILYGKRCPSKHAVKNLQEKKSRFIKAKLIKPSAE